jgi:putative ABC transport system permease protein
MLLSALLMALREIRRNAGRSLLTALGIVIGVGAVIALVTLGQGATAKVQSSVSALGNDMLTVMPGSMRRGAVSSAAPPFAAADVRAVEEEVPSVSAVAPAKTRSALVVYANKNHTSNVTGTTNAWFSIRNWSLGSGRIFNDAELAGSSPACVIGTSSRKQLFGAQDPLGAQIRVGSVACTVIGELQSKGESTFGDDQDDVVVMPLATFQRRVSGDTHVESMVVAVAPHRSSASATSQITALLRERRHLAPGAEDNFEVRDMKEIAKALTSVTGTLTALLGGVAAVSLLVGGIGIMNIMLVSVTERTREIGVRLAIGARAGEVLLQFLVEAVVLSSLGGALGIALGLGGSYGAARALRFPFVLLPAVVVLAFGFSAAVGVGFGYLPARRAARLNPIDALRRE